MVDVRKAPTVPPADESAADVAIVSRIVALLPSAAKMAGWSAAVTVLASIVATLVRPANTPIRPVAAVMLASEIRTDPPSRATTASPALPEITLAAPVLPRTETEPPRAASTPRPLLPVTDEAAAGNRE